MSAAGGHPGLTSLGGCHQDRAAVGAAARSASPTIYIEHPTTALPRFPAGNEIAGGRGLPVLAPNGGGSCGDHQGLLLFSFSLPGHVKRLYFGLSCTSRSMDEYFLAYKRRPNVLDLLATWTYHARRKEIERWHHQILGPDYPL